MIGFSYNLIRLTESHALCLSTEGKSTKTIKWYTANLKRFAQFLSDNHLPDSVTEIGKEEARRFISHLQTGVKRWESHSHRFPVLLPSSLEVALNGPAHIYQSAYYRWAT